MSENYQYILNILSEKYGATLSCENLAEVYQTTPGVIHKRRCEGNLGITPINAPNSRKLIFLVVDVARSLCASTDTSRPRRGRPRKAVTPIASATM